MADKAVVDNPLEYTFTVKDNGSAKDMSSAAGGTFTAYRIHSDGTTVQAAATTTFVTDGTDGKVKGNWTANYSKSGQWTPWLDTDDWGQTSGADVIEVEAARPTS